MNDRARLPSAGSDATWSKGNDVDIQEPHESPPSTTSETDRQTVDQPFLVVGVGASAGGLEALRTLLSKIPAEPGFAIVAIQHLSPKYHSNLDSLLSSTVSLPVFEIEDGMKIERNTIYYNPPDKEVDVAAGVFVLSDPAEAHGLRLPIDHFFRSLADVLGEKAICIVLSGTGSDGTLGIEAVKGAGGMTMAQEELQAKYAGMPHSAIETGLVDYVLPAETMPQAIMDYASHPYVTRSQAPPKQPERDFDDGIQDILGRVRAATGRDFSHYKSNTIRRRVERRMAVHRISDIDGYRELVETHPDEIQDLFRDLLIGVTSFFRDPKAFADLADTAIAQIVAAKDSDQTIRIWAPGCATGEETYTIAMLVSEAMEQQGRHLNVQIFGTDIDADAIAQARSGEYRDSIAADITADRLARYFTKLDGAYRIKQSVRDMMVFAIQDLITDAPFSGLDLVSCRNVMIYLDSELQQRLFPLLHFTLVPEGYLFLGSSETIGVFSDLFTTVEARSKIFQCRPVRHDRVVHYPPLIPLETAPRQPRRRKPRQQRETSLREIIEQIILEDYAPPCVIVNEKYDILFFQRSTDAYLAPPVGKPLLNIIQMAREGLKHRLAAALHRAVTQQVVCTISQVPVEANGRTALVDVTIRPLNAEEGGENLYLVVFDDRSAGVQVSEEGAREGTDGGNEGGIALLERELQSTREHLQVTIEELETANEELKSTNEELQSTNEELQSTNEELETAKEELQSTNEELVTVNAELQNHVEELTVINNDVSNLLASTDIGTLFLDGDLKIRRFTPAVTRVFNLIVSDIGRPVSDITARIVYPDLVADLRVVLETLQTKSIRLQADGGRWFDTRILPYRTADNRVDGVVITFVDVTETRRIEEEGRSARTLFETILDLTDSPLLILDTDLNVVNASSGYTAAFGMSRAELAGASVFAIGDGQWDDPRFRVALGELVANGTRSERIEIEREIYPKAGGKGHRVTAQLAPGSDSEHTQVLLKFGDALTGKGKSR